jgi:hypothetical protein
MVLGCVLLIWRRWFRLCDQQHDVEAMVKTWLLEGREISLDEGSKGINPWKLPLMCNTDLDEIAVSETPGDPVFVAKYQ